MNIKTYIKPLYNIYMAELPEDVAFPAIFEEELLPEEEPFARD
jgi:hypothetical protein